MAGFTNQTVHSVYVNGQQIMTVADTTATTDDVEYGKLFHQANGQAVIGLGNRRAFIKTGDSSTEPEEIENLRAGDLYIIKEDVAENPKTLKVYVYINKINKDGFLEETGSWHNISDLGYSIDKIEELSDKIKALIADDGDNSIRVIAQEEAEKVKESILGEGISETFDTLKEIETWINAQGGSTVELTKAIADEAKTREDADKAINETIATLETNTDAAAKLTEAKGYTDQAITIAKADINTALAGKVDKVEGKSLISDVEIARLANVDNYDDTAIKADIAKKADSTTMTTELNKKVDKVEGYSLVPNTEIERLADVDNYDDTEVRGLINDNAEAIAAINIANLYAKITALEEQLNYAIFGPTQNNFDGNYIVACGKTTLERMVKPSSGIYYWTWASGYDKYYEYIGDTTTGDYFYIPEGWEMTISVVNQDWADGKGTTNFGFRPKDSFSSSYDLYSFNTFNSIILPAGYYLPYMANGNEGYDSEYDHPDPSGVQIDIKYNLI